MRPNTRHRDKLAGHWLGVEYHTSSIPPMSTRCGFALGGSCRWIRGFLAHFAALFQPRIIHKGG